MGPVAALSALLWMAGLTPASATLIDAIHALKPGDKYRVMFVTSDAYVATGVSISTYNADVQNEAFNGSATKNLGLSWTAFVSTASISANENTSVNPGGTDTVFFFNTRGDVIAISDYGLLNGDLLQPISYDKNGKYIGTEVWTGSNSDGTIATGEYMGSSLVIYGLSSYINSAWSDMAIALSTQPYSLYGMSSIATIPISATRSVSPSTISIPEPATVLLIGAGLVGFGWRYRKRT